jgi:hypothetical protein
MRIKGWSKLSSADLWPVWLAEFSSPAEAEATAVWIANRLVKFAARSTRLRFYEVKDLFLNRYSSSLIEGRIARVEKRDCRACLGSGDDGDCERCDGTGIWSERTLYVHYLIIEGTRYSFHNYEKPARLVDIPGEDKESYGGRFTDEEIAKLGLPCSGLVRMLRYRAFTVWPKESGAGKYRNPDAAFDCHCRLWGGPGQVGHHEFCRLKRSA